MKRMLLALALLVSVVGVNADPSNLESGVFITHAPPGFVYSAGMDWCAEYDVQYGIVGCDEQNTNMPALGDPTNPTLFYVVAAWDEAKLWCGTEFGISPDFDETFYFTEYGACLPNHLEITTNGWPGAGEGTAVVATDIQWEGNFVAVYHFLGYCYYSTEIALDVDPAQNFAGTGNCNIPPQIWDAVCLGVMGTGDNLGAECCPEAPALFACCFDDGSCELLTEYDCDQAGGVFHPEWDYCEPNPCPPPDEPGACCLETGECFFILEEDCGAIGGDFLGQGIPCEPNPCPQPTVCCVGELCYIVFSEEECIALDGDWYPEWDTCDPNPCPTPSGGDTWGSIKVLYR